MSNAQMSLGTVTQSAQITRGMYSDSRILKEVDEENDNDDLSNV